MKKHLKHIKYLRALIKRSDPQSDNWWELKDRLKQVQIAWGQAWNLAVQSREPRELDEQQEMFYDKLTAPLVHTLKEEYQATKKSEEKISQDVNKVYGNTN